MEAITTTETTGINVHTLMTEVDAYLAQMRVNVHEDGEHLWTNHEHAVAIILRLGEIHNNIAFLELLGQATPEQKKFRTMIVDPAIEHAERVAAFESRKITARQIEAQLDK